MNKEKQIEEMAKVIAKADDTCLVKTIAERLYNAGYRKQSEGEWIENRKVCSQPYCSVCGAIGNKGSYCSHCGSKMKGGE